MENILPPIPAKRYFTIGEVGDLCGVKPHVLRYWEQEFTQLRPMKRSGNRRYYQHNEVLMIRRIRDLLYDQGFTISGARNKLQEMVHGHREVKRNGDVGHNTLLASQPESQLNGNSARNGNTNGNGHAFVVDEAAASVELSNNIPALSEGQAAYKWQSVRQELFEIRALLGSAL
ncbi:MAG: MerR family transcriptional regulator [Burkholderiaceae bacterium]